MPPKKKKTVYVFHHIPKCGGTSILEALPKWFSVTARDYRDGWSKQYPPKGDLEKLPDNSCLAGHFELEGHHLSQRYPEVFQSDAFKVFTFVRDPLAVRLSLYRFEKENQAGSGLPLEKELFRYNNYLSSIFPVTEENYQEVLERYFFIGILEDCQESMDVLANLIGKPPVQMPWVNKTRRSQKKLNPEILERFRELNALDYKIYDYCLERFKQERGKAFLQSFL